MDVISMHWVPKPTSHELTSTSFDSELTILVSISIRSDGFRLQLAIPLESSGHEGDCCACAAAVLLFWRHCRDSRAVVSADQVSQVARFWLEEPRFSQHSVLFCVWSLVCSYKPAAILSARISPQRHPGGICQIL